MKSLHTPYPIHHTPYTICHILRPKAALSLVELQIAMVIFAGITLLIGSIYYAQTRLFGEEKKTIELSSENRIALDEVTNQTREAVSVVLGCTICGSVTDSSSTVLILSLWPLDSSGEIFEPTSGEYDYIVYKLDDPPNSENLEKFIIPNGTTSQRINTSKILASSTKSILFQYNDPVNIDQSTEVTVTLTSEAKSYIKTHTFSQSSKAVLRNK